MIQKISRDKWKNKSKSKSYKSKSITGLSPFPLSPFPSKLMKSICKMDLIVIDDWGLSELNDQARNDFLEILEDRYRLKSTIIATQLPIEHWHKMIGHPTIADAILDRLVHNAYKINLKGESMRKKQKKAN